MTLKNSTIDIDSFIAKKPLIVGISAHTENIDTALRTAKYIKSKIPDTKVVMGGSHVSLEPEYCMKNKNVDFAIINEGERTLLELLEAIYSNQIAIKYADIDGLIYRDRAIHEKHSKKPITDLDILPLLKREFLANDLELVSVYTLKVVHHSVFIVQPQLYLVLSIELEVLIVFI